MVQEPDGSQKNLAHAWRAAKNNLSQAEEDLQLTRASRDKADTVLKEATRKLQSFIGPNVPMLRILLAESDGKSATKLVLVEVTPESVRLCEVIQ